MKTPDVLREFKKVYPEGVGRRTKLSLEDKFLGGFKQGKKSECWPWLSVGTSQGYGVFHYRRNQWQAHRVSYQYFVGSIKKGLQLDHLCRNRRCVNPSHLEPVTFVENIRRGFTSLGGREQAFIKAGYKRLLIGKICLRNLHMINSEKDLYIYSSGSRYCRKCTLLSQKKRNYKQYLKTGSYKE